jgi:AraC-like DNA-binding protein
MEAGRFSAEEIARKNMFGNRDRMRHSFIRAFGRSPQAIQHDIAALSVLALSRSEASLRSRWVGSSDGIGGG